ncbi:MAG TPA: flagellar hook-basal body complex protein FliE [Rectinemataceae bacterium]|nr:flagellar hook-basal body complex protein FliE [Rectinemataceae bacterium]
MAIDLAQLTAPLRPADPIGGGGAPARLARTNPMHYTADGLTGPLSPSDSVDGAAGSRAGSSATFENSLLKAMDGVNASQVKSDAEVQKMLVNPGTVDVQDVTIAMAEANMSLNIARTILSRVVTAWRDVINTR